MTTRFLSHYEISPEADNDLQDIFDYSMDEFGTDQAIKYLSEFDEIFGKITATPELGRERNEITHGLHSHPFKSHMIFYRIKEDHIRIVRILHGTRDLPKFFI